MESFFLIKPGEILLKQDNQKEFTTRLVKEIKDRLGSIPSKVSEYPGRFFLSVDQEHDRAAAFVLAHCPGLNGFVKAHHGAKQPDKIISAVLEVAREASFKGSLKTFKIETRRSDKSFPLGSYQMSAQAGEAVLAAFPDFVVDVRTPELLITIEIRERAYVYGNAEKGPRGLPSGTSGKGLLLLSGGIDSPVAGYLMAKRGMSLDSVYFHAYPYTSMEAQKKVERLARRVCAWCGHTRLWVVPFTELQMEIKKSAPENATTLMLRMAMMEAADRLAKRIRAKALISGESLGQVASQTAEAMRVTQAPTDLPVFRPLIGTDKEDITLMAKKIGTFEISVLPYEDCCVLFSPKHPILKPEAEELKSLYESLKLGAIIDESLAKAERFVYGYEDVHKEFERETDKV
jgi:thiamine biosynthesis protein ThiI